MTLLLLLIAGFFVLRGLVWVCWRLFGPLLREVWRERVEAYRRLQR